MRISRVFSVVLLLALCVTLPAQTFKSEKFRQAVDVLGLRIAADSLLPDTTFTFMSKDGRKICLRTDPMGCVEHVGIPIFNETLRFLQPSPVYDFLEYATLNWKYKINPNQLHLTRVVFKRGSWESLLNENLTECECSISNHEERFYVVEFHRDSTDLVVVGIPIDYELLNNDTRRNMERAFVRDLSSYSPIMTTHYGTPVNDEMLSIYGTGGLFVIPGKSYLHELLNQNVYYRYTTVMEWDSPVVDGDSALMSECVRPVIVRDAEFPAESFANLMISDDVMIPEVIMELDFHLSNYKREVISLPLSRLKAFCRQQGCGLYFACSNIEDEKIRGMVLISNLSKGYNHLLSLRIHPSQLTSASPKVHADVYLYIPPIDKSKLFGTAPTKKSGANFKLTK